MIKPQKKYNPGKKIKSLILFILAQSLSFILILKASSSIYITVDGIPFTLQGRMTFKQLRKELETNIDLKGKEIIEIFYYIGEIKIKNDLKDKSLTLYDFLGSSSTLQNPVNFKTIRRGETKSLDNQSISTRSSTIKYENDLSDRIKFEKNNKNGALENSPETISENNRDKNTKPLKKKNNSKNDHASSFSSSKSHSKERLISPTKDSTIETNKKNNKEPPYLSRKMKIFFIIPLLVTPTATLVTHYPKISFVRNKKNKNSLKSKKLKNIK